jgi:hypothetical protein
LVGGPWRVFVGGGVIDSHRTIRHLAPLAVRVGRFLQARIVQHILLSRILDDSRSPIE